MAGYSRTNVTRQIRKLNMNETMNANQAIEFVQGVYPRAAVASISTWPFLFKFHKPTDVFIANFNENGLPTHSISYVKSSASEAWISAANIINLEIFRKLEGN